MKVPLKWLADYVPVDLDRAAELVKRLPLAGLEVAGARPIGLPTPPGLRVKAEDRGPIWERDKVVIGAVVKGEKRPNADKLKLPTVEYGEGRTKKMVTGAPNINVGDVGQKVILGMAGSVLFDGHATPKAMKELKPSKIRGEPSDAMVCSSFELGIDEEHEGIILLEEDAPGGLRAADFMGDVVIEFDRLGGRGGGKAPRITVRAARPGEVLKTLDNVERRLTPDMLVIADSAGPIALAGVMGGAETEVGAATTNVLLESANFDFVSIRRTMRALNLPSEASQRFSRGIHP